MQLSQLRNKRVDLAIDIAGDTLNVVYDPNFITPEVEDEIRSATTSDEMCVLLSGMLVEWDLIDDETGEPVPLEVDAMRVLPSVFLAKVLVEINTDTPDEVAEQGKASRATSRRKA